MTAVDQHRQLDAGRTPEVDDGIHGGPHRAPCVEDIVDQDDFLPFDRKGDLRGFDHRLGAHLGPVVPVERDVHLADQYIGALESADVLAQALGQEDTAGVDPHQGHVVALVRFQNFVGHALENAVDPHRIQDLFCFSHGDFTPLERFFATAAYCNQWI